MASPTLTTDIEPSFCLSVSKPSHQQPIARSDYDGCARQLHIFYSGSIIEITSVNTSRNIRPTRESILFHWRLASDRHTFTVLNGGPGAASGLASTYPRPIIKALPNMVLALMTCSWFSHRLLHQILVALAGVLPAASTSSPPHPIRSPKPNVPAVTFRCRHSPCRFVSQRILRGATSSQDHGLKTQSLSCYCPHRLNLA